MSSSRSRSRNLFWPDPAKRAAAVGASRSHAPMRLPPTPEINLQPLAGLRGSRAWSGPGSSSRAGNGIPRASRAVLAWLTAPRVSFRAMSTSDEQFDYHGALVVIETQAGEIVFIHPPGSPAEAPASLPSNPCAPGEAPADGAVRMAREMTGFEVVIVREFVTFIQPGTPTGTMCAHGYLARVTGGSMLAQGPEGPVRAYPLHALPAIVPIRVANQRVLNAYLQARPGPA